MSRSTKGHHLNNPGQNFLQNFPVSPISFTGTAGSGEPKMYVMLWFVFSAHRWIMLNICVKFQQNTFDSFNCYGRNKIFILESCKSGYNCQYKKEKRDIHISMKW